MMAYYFEPRTRMTRMKYLHLTVGVIILLLSNCDQSNGKGSKDSSSDPDSNFDVLIGMTGEHNKSVATIDYFFFQQIRGDDIPFNLAATS